MAAVEKKFSKKYARMLFNATGVEGAEDAIYCLKTVSVIIEKDAGIRSFFQNPVITDSERDETIRSLGKKLGFSDEIVRFLIFIAGKRAVSVLGDITKDYIYIYYEMKKLSRATVYTPIEFSREHERRLMESLRTITGRDVEVEYIKDPDLIGGVVVKVGSTMYDSSLRGQILLMKNQLTGTTGGQA